MSPIILLVEDNPITRKLVRFSLEAEGFQVLDAPDGKSALAAFSQHPVSLVLQDLFLPDMDGFQLASHLRALPGGAEVPLLAFSGMLSHHDEARVAAAGFDYLISKPVEPSRLVQIVRTHLPQEARSGADLFGKGLRIVVADDDLVQRKLVAFRMQKVGFQVTTAADGQEALEYARRSPPHAVLSDVLMPTMDGFRLCRELRADPMFANVPVVLTTNSYVEPADREFARKTGAHDLVLRTPALVEVLDAVRASLRTTPAMIQGRSPVQGEFEGEHLRRALRQLERQLALSAGVNQRCALLSAEISVLKGISEALASHQDIDDALRQTLAACFDAGGISLGALYLKEGDALRVLSFGFSTEWTELELSTFFGERPLLDGAIRSQETVCLPSDGGAEGGRMLAKAGLSSALLVPLGYKGIAFGALVMLSRKGDVQDEDRTRFAQAVAGQISQALAVADAFRAKQRSERAAREQTAVLSSILESIGDGVIVAEETGKFIHWNPAATHLVKMGARGGGAGATHGLFGADQTTPMPLDELPLTRATRGDTVNGVELFARHEGAPDGVWLSVSGRPWRDELGARRGGVAVFRDITCEKATQSQLMVSDRMASMGMLAAGVAHEINNPLACVLANVDLLQREVANRAAAGELGDVGEIKEMLADTRDAADRVRQIVRDLKTFSRHEDAGVGAVDIQKVIDSSLRMSGNEIRHRARLVKDYGDVAFVEGSESRLGQVLLNLIMNAAQAIPEGNAAGNTIRIVTRAGPPGQVIIEISDTGGGIAPENLRQLFRPFFTTKGTGVGTGLGLAICHRIVTGFAGEIQVQSEVGKGTTFRIILKASRGDVATQAPTLSSVRARRRARILVIDDEPMVATAIRRTLAMEHEVQVTSAAREALERIRGGESFDIILCDLMMPQMTGMELYAELEKLGHEHVERIIFLTGGAFTPATRAFLDEVPNLRVEKPFDAQQLRSLVNDRIR